MENTDSAPGPVPWPGEHSLTPVVGFSGTVQLVCNTCTHMRGTTGRNQDGTGSEVSIVVRDHVGVDTVRLYTRRLGAAEGGTRGLLVAQLDDEPMLDAVPL